MSEAAIKRSGKVKTFAELVKFEHSIFALPYAYLGALYGAAVVGGTVATPWVNPAFGDPQNPMPTLWALIWVTVAMVGARSFAFVVNRAVDAEIDARNPRTAGRPIPARTISRAELWVFSAIVLVAYVLACFQLAPITHWLWPIPLAFFVVYPYLKRFTWFCHFWLGICLGLGVTGGWAAVGAPLTNPAPWVLGAAVAIWTAGFDIIYATQDYECDVRDGVHSIPADFGVATGLTVTRITHALTIVLFALGGWLLGVGWAYYAGVAIAAGLLFYENAIISPDDMSRVNAAFFNVNGMVAVVVLLGGVVDRWPR
ncbi:MAG: 4-hydroxybenzoate octaprenyltransferase [Coriobacteriia bacterium]|nr:4-hydroxybenzoate octaprenyltransferase [Coriobacteriia bacterium]